MKNAFRLSALAFCATVALAAGPVAAYEGAVHQKLTFIAARQFNACAAESGLPMLTPLQVRYIAKANVAQAESGFFRRLTRWSYYDRDHKEKSMLWLVETRMHEHFDSTIRRMEQADNLTSVYTNLGRIVSYLQDMTSPAQVVPVFTARWWRFSMTDRFNTFRADAEQLEQMITGECDTVELPAFDFADLLRGTAENTLDAVQSPIDGMPVTWEVFWEPPKKSGSFGEYGPAGNKFGEEAEFRCSDDKRERCVLLENDPLYKAFALDRHLTAVRATMAALSMLQRSPEELAALVPAAVAQGPR